MNKILSILLACTAAGAAYGAQETGQAAKNVAIDSVVVTGARYASDIRHLPMSVAVVDRDEIVRRQEASVLPLLTEQVPGLFVTGRGVMGYGVSDGAAGGISLRGIGGGSAAQMLVLIDGHPQYMGLFGHPIADAYQSMLAERVEVVRGPASVLYGSNAMGGVINIVTRRQREEGVKTDLNVGYGSWNTLQTEAANRIRKGRFTSVVTGSYNRTDGHRADMGFEQYGGYAKVGYEISRRWNAYADVNLTHFNASNPGEITAPVFDNDSRITRGMASVSLENSYDRTSGALKFFYNWGRHRINDGYGAGEEPRDYRFNSKDRMLGVSWYQSAGLWRGSRLTAGIDWQRFGGRAWNRFTADGREEPIVDQTEDEIAGYADFRQSLGRLTVDAGVRIDHHTRTGTEWVPQAGISLRAARDGALKAMVSKGFRNPVLRELYMFGVKNPDLKPERLWNYELSWTSGWPEEACRTASTSFISRARTSSGAAGQTAATSCSTRPGSKTGAQRPTPHGTSAGDGASMPITAGSGWSIPCRRPPNTNSTPEAISGRAAGRCRRACSTSQGFTRRRLPIRKSGKRDSCSGTCARRCA